MAIGGLDRSLVVVLVTVVVLPLLIVVGGGCVWYVRKNSRYSIPRHKGGCIYRTRQYRRQVCMYVCTQGTRKDGQTNE